jgi:hypothetical protein
MTDSFRNDFLAGIAKAIGVSAEDMSQNYSPVEYSQARAYERAIQGLEAQRRMYQDYSNVLLQRAIVDAMLVASIKLPLADEIRYITGYHPQRLLEHKPEITTTRSIVRYEDGSIESLTSFAVAYRNYSEKSDPWPFEKFFHRDLGEEFIPFPEIETPTRYYIEGGHFDMYDREPRKLAPFVSPTGRREKPIVLTGVRLSYPHIEPRQFKRAVIVVGADYSDVEARILAASAHPDVLALHIDLESPGGDLRGLFDVPGDFYRKPIRDTYPRDYRGRFELRDDDVVDTAAGKRDKSYLKHDPSKSHKRRKRK